MVILEGIIGKNHHQANVMNSTCTGNVILEDKNKMLDGDNNILKETGKLLDKELEQKKNELAKERKTKVAALDQIMT